MLRRSSASIPVSSLLRTSSVLSRSPPATAWANIWVLASGPTTMRVIITDSAAPSARTTPSSTVTTVVDDDMVVSAPLTVSVVFLVVSSIMSAA